MTRQYPGAACEDQATGLPAAEKVSYSLHSFADIGGFALVSAVDGLKRKRFVDGASFPAVGLGFGFSVFCVIGLWNT